MRNIKNMLNKSLKNLCSFILVFMVLLATWQIITRYVLNNPSTISEELLIYCFVWMSLLGAAYVFGKRDHMAMTFMVSKFSKEKQCKLSILSEVLVLIFAALVLVLGGSQITILAMGQVSPALGVPMGYLYSILPLSGMIIGVYNFINISEIIKELSTNKDKNTSEQKTFTNN